MNKTHSIKLATPCINAFEHQIQTVVQFNPGTTAAMP